MQIGITSRLGLPLQAWRQNIQYLVANNIFNPKSINHHCQCLGQQLGSPMDPNPFMATLTTPRSGHIKAGSRLGKLLDHGFRTKSNTTILGQPLVLNKKNPCRGLCIHLIFPPLWPEIRLTPRALLGECVEHDGPPRGTPCGTPCGTLRDWLHWLRSTCAHKPRAGTRHNAHPLCHYAQGCLVDLPGMMDDDGEWFTMGTVDEIFFGTWHLPVTVKESSSQGVFNHQPSMSYSHDLLIAVNQPSDTTGCQC